MSDNTPQIDELKYAERLKIEIPAEEEPVKAQDGRKTELDITDELRKLGHQFAQTLQTAWNSEERQRIEADVREGMRSFANEIDKAVQTARNSETGSKVKSEASQVASKLQASEATQKARVSFANSLQWLSEELGSLAKKFNPADKTESNQADK